MADISKPHEKDAEYLLVVEGYGDLLFYAEMIEFIGLHGRVFIKHFNGTEDLMMNIGTYLSPGRVANKTTAAVIVDGDLSPASRIQSLSQLLSTTFDRTLQHGIWSKGQPNLGYFVVPDGKQPGEVETLAWNAWANDPNNAGPKQCIDDYLSCMAEKGHTAHSPDKGKISALLAVKYDEDPRLGPGARHNVFDFNRPEYEPLLTFLRGFSE